MGIENSDKNIENTITRIVKTFIQSDSEINQNDSLRDLGMDSLLCMRIIVELENEFNIEIEDEDLLIEKYENISSINMLVSKLLSES